MVKWQEITLLCMYVYIYVCENRSAYIYIYTYKLLEILSSFSVNIGDAAFSEENIFTVYLRVSSRALEVVQY